jgi:hypothetical protein
VLLDSGIGVHTVAELGHDPAALLRDYAKRK